MKGKEGLCDNEFVVQIHGVRGQEEKLHTRFIKSGAIKIGVSDVTTARAERQMIGAVNRGS